MITMEDEPDHRELVEQAESVLGAVEGTLYYPVAHGEAQKLQGMIEKKVQLEDDVDSGSKVTLEKDIPEPENWEQNRPYYYVHKETGREILEEVYYGKVKKRNTLARYIEEVDPADEEVPRHV